ncbi:MAG: ATP-binding cassette domain-containing protein [Candidatus Thorarchaeota archaeon]
MNTNNNIIVLHQLSKNFGPIKAVNRVDLSVKEATVHGFLGPNGSGKTTTIRMILGLLKPSKGYVKVFGYDLQANEKKIKEKIGYLPGDLYFYNYYTVKQLLNYLESLRGISADK